MVAPVIQCFELDQAGWFPLNIPNHGQVADLPDDVTVESMCVADGKGVRGRDEVHLPPRDGRVAATGCRRRRSSPSRRPSPATATRSFEAMLLDPLAGRIDYDQVGEMTDEMLAATKAWLPQFASV